MKRALIVVGLSCLFAAAAHARASGKPAAAMISVAKVERSVTGLATMRRTAGFDASFKEAVSLITQLHSSGSEADKVDAQDLAVTALHFYMDHQNIDLGSDEESRQVNSRRLAADTGLLPILGW